MTDRRISTSYPTALAVAAMLVTAQPAVADRADDVRQAIGNVTTWIETVSGGVAKLTTAGPMRIEPDGQRLRVTLPELRLVVKEKDQVDVEIQLGTVSFHQSDAANGRWRLQGMLPNAMQIKEGKDSYRWTVGGSRFDVELDPSDGLTYASELAIERLAGAVPGGQSVAVAAIQGKSTLTPDADGRWTSPASLTLSDLRVLNDKGATLGRIDAVDAKLRTEGIALDRARALQSRFSRIAGSKDGPDQAMMIELLDLLTKPAFILRGLGYDLTLKGLAVSEDGSQPLGQLAELKFGFALGGLDTNSATITWGYRHDGLAASGAIPIEASLVPKAGELAFALRGIPLASVIEAVQATLAGSPPPGAMDDPQQFLTSLFARSGTVFEISRLGVDTDKAGLELKAEAAANADSPYSAVGRAELALRGLEALVAAVDGFGLGPIDPAGIAVVAALGQQEKRADGAVIRRYRFEVKPDGALHLNDNDITALIPKTQSLFETAKTEPEPMTKEDRGPGAQGDAIERLSAELISGLLEAQGLQPERQQNRSGDPRLLVRRGTGMKAEELWVDFTGCNAEGECDDAMIWAWVKPNPPAKLEKVNEWNGGNRWSRVYLDQDDDARIEMDFRATGGVMPARIEEALGQFMEILPRFIDRFTDR